MFAASTCLLIGKNRKYLYPRNIPAIRYVHVRLQTVDAVTIWSYSVRLVYPCTCAVYALSFVCYLL